MSLSAMFSDFNLATTVAMRSLFCLDASATLDAVVSTPMFARAISGFAVAMPSPTTVMLRVAVLGAGLGAVDPQATSIQIAPSAPKVKTAKRLIPLLSCDHAMNQRRRC